MSDEPETPSFTRVLQRMASSMLRGMHVCIPARVESYDADRQCVNAQPWIADQDIVEGVEVVGRFPVVTNCPVEFPRSGGYAITFPIEIGSTVILHFTSASLDRWLAIGGEVAPGDGRKLTLNDAFAMPAGHSFAGASAPSTTAPTDAMVLHVADLLRLGGPSASSIPALVAELIDLKSRIAAWTPVAGDGGASLKAVFAAWSPAGATKVRVQ